MQFGEGSRLVASIDPAHAALLKDDRLQFDLPDAATAPSPSEPWLSHMSWGGSSLGWTIVVGAVVLTLVVIWQVWRARPAKPIASPSTEAQPVIRPEIARATLRTADELAAQKRFTQAVRILLGCGIDEISRRFPGLLRPATTSRDIGALEDLPQSLRGPFSRIAAVVETGVFGERTVSADDYASCRLDFVTSALAGRS